MRQAVLLLLGIVLSCSSVFAQGFESLDATEQRAMSDTFQYALESNKTDQPSSWVNPDGNHSGGVTPVRTYTNTNGQPCREFTQTIIIGDREEQGYGTACRQPDGTWQIVADEAPQAAAAKVAPAENRTVVYVNETPWPSYYRYVYYDPYDYWYPYYYPSYFTFSFNYVYYSGKYYSRPHVRYDGVRRYPATRVRTDYVSPWKIDYDHYKRPGVRVDQRPNRSNQRYEYREREHNRNRWEDDRNDNRHDRGGRERR